MGWYFTKLQIIAISTSIIYNSNDKMITIPLVPLTCSRNYYSLVHDISIQKYKSARSFAFVCVIIFWSAIYKLKPIWIRQYALRLSSMICKPTGLKSFVHDSFLPLAIYHSVHSYSVEIMIQFCHKLFVYNVKRKELRSIEVIEEESVDACSLRHFSKFTFINRSFGS